MSQASVDATTNSIRRRDQRVASPESTIGWILGASAELFARNGYHATGIAELLAALDLSRGSLYYHSQYRRPEHERRCDGVRKTGPEQGLHRARQLVHQFQVGGYPIHLHPGGGPLGKSSLVQRAMLPLITALHPARPRSPSIEPEGEEHRSPRIRLHVSSPGQRALKYRPFGIVWLTSTIDT